MTSTDRTQPAISQVQLFILQRLRDAGRPMILRDGSARTQLAQFTGNEWGMLTRVTVIDSLLRLGYIERVGNDRCQLTASGAQVLGARRGATYRVATAVRPSEPRQ